MKRRKIWQKRMGWVGRRRKRKSMEGGEEEAEGENDEKEEENGGDKTGTDNFMSKVNERRGQSLITF